MTGPPDVVLAWGSPDPIGLGGRLRESLGLISLPAGGGRFLAALRRGALVLRPAPGDERLSVVSWAAAGFQGVGMAGAASPSGPAPEAELVGVGWATVDLERAAGRFGRLRFGDPVADPSLGARAVVAAVAGGPALVLLEPSREGRLAATLARLGEGPCVLYVALDRRPSAAAPGRPVDGPFGPQVPFPSVRPWGPHLVGCGPASLVRPGPGGVPSDA